jgi:hypothetical protein
MPVLGGFRFTVAQYSNVGHFSVKITCNAEKDSVLFFPMKTITLQVDQEIAKQILDNYEETLSIKRNERNELSEEIADLEQKLKSLREQINGSDGDIARSPTGENKAKIKSYLQTIAGNKGAKMSDIVKGTGIGTSSVNFTLTNKKNADTFVKDGKVWKLVM